MYADQESPDAGEMVVKARLATKIGEIIKHRHLSQQQAADVLGMTQPKLSNMLRGQFRGAPNHRPLSPRGMHLLPPVNPASQPVNPASQPAQPQAAHSGLYTRCQDRAKSRLG